MFTVFCFLRSLVFMTVLSLVTIVWAPICFLFAPLPYNQRYWATARWNVFIVWAAKAICGMRYQTRGFENFPDGPAILLSKHQSRWETIFLLQATPRPLVFVFKKAILYIPFFGWAIALMKMIPIDRNRGKDAFSQVVKIGRERLADGQWVIMFPEGTRIPVGKKGQYKSGGSRLAIETNTPIIPIALNSGECWPKNSFIKWPGTITVSVGPPISPEGMTPNELMAKVECWIEAEMRVISPQVYPETKSKA